MANFYVDFSAANNGDGSDGAQAGAPAGAGAFNVFTGTESALISDNDVVWFRRTPTADTQPVTFAMGTGPKLVEKKRYFGWPLSVADEHYALAQATSNTVTATWNADTEPFTVIDPVPAAWTPEYIQVYRMHAEEVGAGANHFTDHNTGTPRDSRFHLIKCSRNNQQPTLRAGNNARGVMEYDDVHIRGTTPGIIRCTGHSTDCSTLLRVRIEFTDTGSSGMDITGTDQQPRSGMYEILEWIDPGTHWITTFFGFGGGGGAYTFTTDDDVVGQLNYVFSASFGIAQGSANVIIRNLNLDHTLVATPDIPLRTPAEGYNHHYENITLHPTGHVIQIDASGSRGILTARNLINFDSAKVDTSDVLTNTEGAYKYFVHLAQINGTEAWYRLENGSVAQISAITRTGGAANAILVDMMDRPLALQNRGHNTGVFRSEFKGLEAFAFVKTGLSYPATQTLTAYFAVGNWDSEEDKHRIWYEIEAYQNAAAGDFTRRVIDSRKLPNSQAFIADASVWTGLLGHTGYRVEIPVTIVKDDIIKVRFFIRDTFLDNGAQRNYVVFDPDVDLA